jgi:anti-anti-sigma regulatory factor
MLRISYSPAEYKQQWTLCGRLTGSWVQELRLCWEHHRRAASGMRAVVDLSDVTFIDEAGESLLSAMNEAGVEFVAAGVETKDLIANLTGTGQKMLRRVAAPLSDRAHPCDGERATQSTAKED